MGLINEYLKKIKEAVYGEEVRDSIHDAIEQCYKDATGHPDSVAAVIKENKEMQEHLDNTPYMTVEEGESADLPVHTINDDEIGVASTWSSEKINGKIQEVFQSASNGKSKLWCRTILRAFPEDDKQTTCKNIQGRRSRSCGKWFFSVCL